MPTPRINWVLASLYTLISLGVLVAAVVSPAVREVAYAPLREWVMPEPKPVVVSVLYSTEKAEWLAEVALRFEAARPRVDGHPIELELKKMGSREMYLAVLDGDEQPDLISPASRLQISLLEDLSTAKYGAPVVRRTDLDTCRPVLLSPVVLVAWKERADVLWGSQPGADLWPQLHDAVVRPQGWPAIWMEW